AEIALLRRGVPLIREAGSQHPALAERSATSNGLLDELPSSGNVARFESRRAQHPPRVDQRPRRIRSLQDRQGLFQLGAAFPILATVDGESTQYPQDQALGRGRTPGLAQFQRLADGPERGLCIPSRARYFRASP